PGLLLEDRHLTGDALAECRSDHSEVVDVQAGARHEVLELLVGADAVHLLRGAADQHEAVQVTAVRVEEADLEALDPTFTLALSEELDCGVESVDRGPLASAYDLAPTDEQASIGHLETSSVGSCKSAPNLRLPRGRIKVPDCALDAGRAAGRKPPRTSAEQVRGTRRPRAARAVPGLDHRGAAGRGVRGRPNLLGAGRAR